MGEQIDETVSCVPMNVDAFILNERVCDSKLVRIAPITQPDYVGLRPTSTEIARDVLQQVDISHSQPAAINPRISAVETPNPAHLDAALPESEQALRPPLRNGRIGVCISWSLPRLYRSATSATDSFRDLKKTNVNASQQPVFRPVPNRWLVIRVLRDCEPPEMLARMPFQGWVIESDRLWEIDDIPLDADVQAEMSPYLDYQEGDESKADTLQKQARFFIGTKVPLKTWPEQGDSIKYTSAPLTVMNSSNILFADNAHHNANVFSMTDNFEFLDSEGNQAHLTKAECDYTVIGWHSNDLDDPMNPRLGIRGPFRDRLKAMFCKLDDRRGTFGEKMGNFDWTSSTVCHGTIYGVKYERNEKPPTPAELSASLFTSDVRMEPTSIGTTALDSVLTFLKAHEQDAEPILGPGTDSVAEALLSLSEILYASEDNYDSRVKASDLIYAHNFARSAGEHRWVFDGKAAPGGPPAQPSTKKDDLGKSDVDYLRQLNDLQAQLEVANRKLKLVKWSLFASWWKFVSDPEAENSARLSDYVNAVADLRRVALGLIDLIANPDLEIGLQAQLDDIIPIDGSSPRVDARKVASPPFFKRKEPVLCVAGMDAGWDARYLSTVLSRFAGDVRVDDQYLTTAQSLTPNIPNLHIKSAVLKLLQEALKADGHDGQLGFKLWQGQPWCPLFTEWSATYYHIPREKWEVTIANSPVGNNHDQVRYTVKDALYKDPESTADQRTVSGRCLILPQPTFNLQALVAQILDIAGVDSPPGITDPAEFIASVGRLKFISTELTGITSNLLTTTEGSHVQPNFRVPGQENVKPLEAAMLPGRSAGLTFDDYVLMGDDTGETPYGTLINFRDALRQPFKGVTHGQLRFTKFNIVDKFGQVIAAIQPDGAPPDSIYPCLGDQVCPGVIEEPDGLHLNTVAPLIEPDLNLPGGYPLCPYIQLTPAINQDARLNAAFILPGSDSNGTFTGWTASYDWDQPIWGWLVINYANQGLQFFTGDGTFYVELTFGGPEGTLKSANWLPFEAKPQADTGVSSQLRQLIQNMTGDGGTEFQLAFWDMVTQAVENMPYAPPEYAAFPNAIVGKPLALTNVGLSLELATEPLRSQVTLKPELDEPDEAHTLLSYEFPIKIGDAERPYDGVVGYFDTNNDRTGSASNGSTDWTRLNTYFVSRQATIPTGDPRVLIEPSTFPKLSPYYVEPNIDQVDNSFLATHAAHFMVKTVIVDPYTPLHVYSPILPITSLQLPAWTVQSALQRMSACFHTSDPKTTPLILSSCIFHSWSMPRYKRCAKGLRPKPTSSIRHLDQRPTISGC